MYCCVTLLIVLSDRVPIPLAQSPRSLQERGIHYLKGCPCLNRLSLPSAWLPAIPTDCTEFCRICSSDWTCLACQEGLTIVNEVCTAPKECAAVEYWDEGTHRCQPCHRKCSRCSGPAEDQCYTCPGETLLLSELHHPSSPYCLSP